MHNKEELENIVPSKAILKQIWEHSTHQGKILPSSRKPLGYVLGGQPGSGKSVLTETIKKNNKILLASMVTNTEVGILIFLKFRIHMARTVQKSQQNLLEK